VYGLSPRDQTRQGGPSEHAGRWPERASNGAPRWMVADRSFSGLQNPAYRSALPPAPSRSASAD